MDYIIIIIVITIKITVIVVLALFFVCLAYEYLNSARTAATATIA